MKNPFDDESFVSPSMNQVRMMGIDGVMLPAEVQGKRSYELLSAEALRGRVAHHAAALRLDPAAPDLLRQLNGRFDSPLPEVQQTATLLGREFGRFLAYHLLTLKQGKPESQAMRQDWTPRHWAWWGQIERVWLGGGLLSGRLGEVMVAEAQRQMASQFPTFRLALAPHARYLPLLGAARSLPIQEGQALAFDFGQTAVKRAVAVVKNGQLIRLRLLPTLSAQCGDPFAPATPERAQERMAFLRRVVGQTWRKVSGSLHPFLALSVSTYLWRGHPRGDWGCYGCIRLLTENMTALLRAEFGAQLGQTIEIELLHDGHAAGLTAAGERQTAVLTLGTALGIGFPPETTAGLLPLAPEFRVGAIV